MKKLFTTLIFLGILSTVSAQELNCIVNVNAQQIEGSERVVFQEMQKAIYQFVNGRKWTNDEYAIDERIDCSILINLDNRISSNQFSGNIQIQASRPVYNTSYKSPIMNIRDENFVVTYSQFEPLIYNEGAYSGELTTILVFYIYMMLGWDYDSFSLEGGTSFFQEAQRIVNNAQSSSEQGWKGFESRANRYWYIENTLNARFKPMRKMFYEYHRKGLDIMEQDVIRARNVISRSLKELRPVHNVEPSSYNMQTFFNAKMQEIVNLYGEATEPEINEITELLITIDPGNSNNYEKLRKRK